MDFEDQVEELWEELLRVGAVIPDGEHLNGEPSYTFDTDILEEFYPELYHSYMDELDADILELAEKGLLSLDFTGPEVMVSLTPKGEEYAKTVLDALNQT